MIGRGPSVTHLAEFVNGNAFKPEDFADEGVPVVRIRQLVDESADCDLAPVPPRPVWLADGDLVFSWSATLAVRFWTRGKAILNQHLFRVDVGPRVDRRWFAYVLEEAARRLQPLMHGSAMTHITRDMLKSVTVPVPELGTQQALADALDAEIADIEELARAKRQILALLSERVNAQLRQLVDPRRDGGIRTLPIRRVLRKQARPVREHGIVTAFRDGIVALRSRRREEGFTESDTLTGYQGVEPGDVVFHGLDGFAGAIGVSQDRGMCSPVYHVCEALPGFDADYVALALRALALSGYLELQSGNVRERAVDFRNWDALARVPIPVPALEEQRSLAQAYNSRRRWSDQVVDAIGHQTNLLSERRAALVSAAVTRTNVPSP